MKLYSILIATLFILVKICRGLKPAQLCQIDSVLHTDMCMAMKSVKSQHDRGHDLLMTFSVKFYQRSGWVAFAVGSLMDRALMFVLWPGENEGDIVLSLRSTTGHLPPKPLKNQGQVHVHTTEIDENGFHVLRATCYSCETVGLGELNATTERQPWLFATSYGQQTQTSDRNLRMTLHSDYGLRMIDMAKALSSNQNEDHPTVTADRSVVHVVDPLEPNKVRPSTRRWTYIDIWNLHGSILSFSVVLSCLGIVLIRSGSKWAFRGHWMVQAISACGLLIGCFIGVLNSTNIFQLQTFTSLHKLIGLVIMIALPTQIVVGYKHHTNYLEYGHRTKASFVHIYFGRLLFIGLNANVLMGLLHAGKSSTFRWGWVAVVLVETLLLGGITFVRRKNSGKGYQNVGDGEVDAYVIGDEEEKWDSPNSGT